MKKLSLLFVTLLSMNSMALFEGGNSYSNVEDICRDNAACYGWATTTSLPTWIVESDDLEVQENLINDLIQEALYKTTETTASAQVAEYLNANIIDVQVAVRALYESDEVTIENIANFLK